MLEGEAAPRSSGLKAVGEAPCLLSSLVGCPVSDEVMMGLHLPERPPSSQDFSVCEMFSFMVSLFSETCFFSFAS